MDAGLTVDQAELAVSGAIAEDKIYDGTTAATLDTILAALVGVIGGDDVTLDTSAAVSEFADSNVGTWAVTVSGMALTGGASGNYFLTQPVLSANILPVPVPPAPSGSNTEQIERIIDETLNALQLPIPSSHIFQPDVVIETGIIDLGGLGGETGGWNADIETIMNVGEMTGEAIFGMDGTDSASDGSTTAPKMRRLL